MYYLSFVTRADHFPVNAQLWSRSRSVLCKIIQRSLQTTVKSEQTKSTDIDQVNRYNKKQNKNDEQSPHLSHGMTFDCLWKASFLSPALSFPSTHICADRHSHSGLLFQYLQIVCNKKMTFLSNEPHNHIHALSPLIIAFNGSSFC